MNNGLLGQLVPQGGGDPIPLIREKLLIGRRDSCDIALRFPNVSSHHCEMEFRNGYWLVRDLGSANGTKVNGVRVDEKFILPGDEISVARHRFKIDYEPLAEGPPPHLEEEDVLGKSLMERAEETPKSNGRIPSLMEKAGLERGPRHSSPAPRKPKTAADKAEDEALKWLEDEDQS